MFHRLVFCGVVALLLAPPATARGADVASAELPAIALGEDVFQIWRADLDSVDFTGVRQTAGKTLDPQEILFYSLIQNRDFGRRTLLEAGVQRLVRIDAMTDRPGFIWLLQAKAGADVGKIEVALKKLLPWYMRESEVAALAVTRVGNWFVAAPRGLKVDLPPQSGEHSERLLAAWKSLGKRPGVVFVPSKQLLAVFDNQIAAQAAAMPPGIAKLIKLLRQLEWAAVAAKLDDKPALKLILQMPGEQPALELAAAYTPTLKTLQAMMPAPAADEDDGSRPMFSYMIPTLIRLQPAATGSRVMVAADAATSVSLLDMFFVMPNRTLLRMTTAPGLERLSAVMDWVRMYRSCEGKWPRTLADLKPLLGESPAQREQLFKQLLTHPKTKEFPSIVYTMPKADPAPNAEGDETGPVLLVEVKDGKPDPAGWQCDTLGQMTAVRSSENK